MVQVVLDVIVDNAQGFSEVRWCRWVVGREQRGQEAATELGVGDGKADPFGGERVGIGVFDAA